MDLPCRARARLGLKTSITGKEKLIDTHFKPKAILNPFTLRGPVESSVCHSHTFENKLGTPVLIKLHWLPIKFRIQFKVLLLVYKALNGLAPKYIKELFVPYKPRRHLRSEAKGLLDEPRTRLKFGDCAFSISAPRLSNALPQHLKDSTSCQAFKKCLKTHLFRLAH